MQYGADETLFDQHDIVVADNLAHASIIDGLQDSGAQLKRFYTIP